jgi:hypothetical protein
VLSYTTKLFSAPREKPTKHDYVPKRTDIQDRLLHDGVCGGTKASQPDSSEKRGRDMETILIVVLIVFLLGGGGWGYSRWRG